MCIRDSKSRGEGDHRRDRRRHTEQDRMRQSGDEIYDVHQDAFADRHENDAGHRSADFPMVRL